MCILSDVCVCVCVCVWVGGWVGGEAVCISDAWGRGKGSVYISGVCGVGGLGCVVWIKVSDKMIPQERINLAFDSRV